MVKTLIFDCDGVLADTERYGHLVAFNQTFREFGLPVAWSEEEYGRRLKIGGGKERMASLLTPEFVAAAGLPAERAAQLAAVAKWHKRKTAIYKGLVAEGRLPGRPGIRRIVAAALEAGWRLAVASTSAQEAVEAILDYAVGKDLAARFAGVFAGDIVPRKKPAPDIYLHALQQLQADPEFVLVVEDSRNGLEAAVAAGLRCLITINGYTKDEDFTEAVLVVSSLGDPGGESARVIANRTSARIGDWVTLADLDACLAEPRPSVAVSE